MEYNILYKQQSIDLPLGFHQWQASEKRMVVEPTHLKNCGSQIGANELPIFGVNISQKYLSCHHRLSMTNSFLALLLVILSSSGDFVLVDFCCSADPLIQPFFGTSIEETTQNCSNTLTVVQWVFQIGSIMAKKQHAFTKNLKKPAVANGDLGANFSIKSLKMWSLLTQVQHKFNSKQRIKGWSSYGKLRLCLKRFTTSLQTTPTKVLNATWVKCTTIDGRNYCTHWFGWYPSCNWIQWSLSWLRRKHLDNQNSLNNC